MGVVSALYVTAGQAGGSGFVAVMTFATFPQATTSYQKHLPPWHRDTQALVLNALLAPQSCRSPLSFPNLQIPALIPV